MIKDNRSVSDFEWDEFKNRKNYEKHGITFFDAQAAFWDANCVIARDLKHSGIEERYYCFGKVEGEVVTVRFTYRDNKIRIFGAGYWRSGRKIYEESNKEKSKESEESSLY